ncbi:cation:proton antiporter [Oculatella sp. LEGE 06141]|uniref:cation:proton antiporter domain-containing protein n=1 Tax=Oculatella sp. LEGE 06141 TaxID=1828648 RepID=UPI0018802E63|nr:cation:proton antiporter [Oculatella sp. LEGE 06141]MBE9177068.1 cation:proton antiporter [Oculatella sp. LEGE 06141]
MHIEPIVSFAILLAVILIVPLCFERLRLPGLLGLLLAGVALGPNGLNVFETESETIRLLSDIGLVYLLFMSGLEIDIEQFQATKHRSASFGFFTFIVPLITGTIVGRLFGFDWNASILIGSLFASHTLLAYPIVSRLGVVNNEAVLITIGATIFTDIGALLVLAICIGVNQGEFTVFSLVRLLLSLIIYSAIVLFGFNWLGKEFFRRSGDEEGNQFLFVLLAVFVAALGAEVIGIEKIVGAFLAGLAVNSVVGDGPVKEKVLFVGSVLFVPVFFIDLGLLIDVPAFISSLGAIWLTLAILVGLISSKFVAALLAKLAFRYSWREMVTMWSLSIPQVAATLAATLVGYRAGILSEGVLNGVIVLMLVTATLGPVITARSAIGLTVPETNIVEPEEPILDTESTVEKRSLSIVVPVYNPQTERYLIEMAAMLVRYETGKIVPLSVTTAHAHMDAPQLQVALARSTTLLQRATEMSQSLGVKAEPLYRIDDSTAQGISRASREQNADLIIMGWGKTTGLRARLFGNVIDSVLWASHCPVAVTRLLDPPANIRRILVPIENLSQRAGGVIRFADILAAASNAQVTLLHICDTRTTSNRIEWIESQLKLLVSRYSPDSNSEIQIVKDDHIAGAILNEAKSYDLVVLRSVRRRMSFGELAISDVTTEVVKQLNCSIVMLGEPQRFGTLLPRTRDGAMHNFPEQASEQGAIVE